MEKWLFDSSIPAEVLPTLKRTLKGLDWLSPSWCHQRIVYWESGDSNPRATIRCNADFEYRRVVLTYYPAFLECGEDEQRLMTVHDLLHGFTSPVLNYVQDEIDRLLPGNESPKYKGLILDELRVRNEGATQDLAWAIVNRFKKNND